MVQPPLVQIQKTYFSRPILKHLFLFVNNLYNIDTFMYVVNNCGGGCKNMYVKVSYILQILTKRNELPPEQNGHQKCFLNQPVLFLLFT